MNTTRARQEEISSGELVTGKDTYTYLWDSYDKNENSMCGKSFLVENMTGIIVKSMPTKNIRHYGWVVKILTSDRKGDIVTGWIWSDLLVKAGACSPLCSLCNYRIYLEQRF